MGVEFDKKHAAIAMRACYRSASKHPVVVLMILFTIWLRRSFPLLFSLLIYASPVIVSTAFLLGALLLFGHQNPPKIQKEEKRHHHETHNQKIRVVEDTEWKGIRSEPRENAFGKKISVVDNVNITEDHPTVEVNSRRSSIGSNVSMADKKLIQDYDHPRVEINSRRSSIGSSVSMVDKKLIQDQTKSEVSNHNHNPDLGDEKIVIVNGCVQFHPLMANITEDHKRCETRSELAESSSLTASMAETFPVVYEFPHLLEPEVPHHVHALHVHKSEPEVPHHAQMTHVHTDAATDHSLESDDDDHEEEEENANEDDQKNLRNFGKSEQEKHMDNLIARKKAIRNMRVQAEENLVNINLDLSYSATPIASTRRNSVASTRRNSFDVPIDFNETIIESAPSVMMPTMNTFELPYDPNREKSYPVGATFQSDSSSFQPHEQFSHHHENFDVGPSRFGVSTQNEGYYISGVSQSRSSSSDDDHGVMMKLHQVAEGGYRLDEVSDHVSQRNRLSDYDDTMKLHQVAKGDGGLYEVKTSGVGDTGYQVKSSSESSSSSFSDVADHIDDEEEDQFRSPFMPSTPELRHWQIQEQGKEDDHTFQQSPKEHDDHFEEGRLSQRPSQVHRSLKITSWFGWKQ